MKQTSQTEKSFANLIKLFVIIGVGILITLAVVFLFGRGRPGEIVGPATDTPTATAKTTVTPPIVETPTITIGVAIALTGEKAAAIGAEQKIGIQIAKEYFVERGYNITLYDNIDAGDNIEKATKAFEHLVSKDVVAIIGPTLSAQALTVDEIAEKKRIPVVAISNTHPNILDFLYVFRVSAGIEQYAPTAISRVPLYEKVTNAILLYLNEPANSFTIPECKEGFGPELANSNKINLVDPPLVPYKNDILNPNDDSALNAVVNSVFSAQPPPDLVVICGLTDDGVALIKALRDKENQSRLTNNGTELEKGSTNEEDEKIVIIGGNGLRTPSLLSLCNEACEGTYFVQAYDYTSNIELNGFFKERYQKRNPSIADAIPTHFAAQAFTGVQVIVEAIEDINKKTNETFANMSLDEQREALREHFSTSGQQFKTLLGDISFKPDGEISQERFELVQIIGNKFVIK